MLVNDCDLIQKRIGWQGALFIPGFKNERSVGCSPQQACMFNPTAVTGLCAIVIYVDFSVV